MNGNEWRNLGWLWGESSEKAETRGKKQTMSVLLDRGMKFEFILKILRGFETGEWHKQVCIFGMWMNLGMWRVDRQGWKQRDNYKGCLFAYLSMLFDTPYWWGGGQWHHCFYPFRVLHREGEQNSWCLDKENMNMKDAHHMWGINSRRLDDYGNLWIL